MHPQAVGLTPKQTTCAPAGSQNCYGPMAPIFPCCQLGFLCSSPLPVPPLSLGVRTRYLSGSWLLLVELYGGAVLKKLHLSSIVHLDDGEHRILNLEPDGGGPHR